MEVRKEEERLQCLVIAFHIPPPQTVSVYITVDMHVMSLTSGRAAQSV